MGAKWVFLSSVFAWALAVGVGETALLNFSAKPGVHVTVPTQWPSESKIEPSSQLPTLVLFLHPKCPCSRATAGELSKIMTHSQRKASVYVLFNRPEGVSEEWLKSDLRESVARIPGVRVLEDADGVEAGRFHSLTSGQALLYDTRGRLLFEGGITKARGHFGGNLGAKTLRELIEGKTTDKPAHFSVFGCSLFNLNKQKVISS